MPDLANCSLAQQNFLKKQTRLRNRVRLARLLIFLGFLVLWEASTRMHLIDAFIFSSPTGWSALFSPWDGTAPYFSMWA